MSILICIATTRSTQTHIKLAVHHSLVTFSTTPPIDLNDTHTCPASYYPSHSVPVGGLAQQRRVRHRVDELHNFRVGTFIMKVLVILLNGLKLDQIA